MGPSDDTRTQSHHRLARRSDLLVLKSSLAQSLCIAQPKPFTSGCCVRSLASVKTEDAPSHAPCPGCGTGHPPNPERR